MSQDFGEVVKFGMRIATELFDLEIILVFFFDNLLIGLSLYLMPWVIDKQCE